MKAIRVHNPGGPEALVYEDVPEPALEAGQALVKMESIGVNFADVYARRGNPGAVPPINIGIEGAGTVTAVAPGVTEVAVGDRVAIGAGPITYREVVAWPAARLVKLPDALSFKDAAASILQGMTAQYLACTTFPLQPGQTCLVHAAAGGVGLLLTQIAKMRGARVIGTVSTPAKAQAARAAGADEVIIYEDVDFEDAVKRYTDGKGVDVVYDGVGQTTFLKGLACLRPRGMMVLFGRASGAPDLFDIGRLYSGGSLFLTQCTLASYTLTPEELQERAGDVFGWVASGKLKLTIHDEYALSDASKAHAALEQRETIGKLLLIP
jgi:NADPH2:quinone reductase